MCSISRKIFYIPQNATVQGPKSIGCDTLAWRVIRCALSVSIKGIMDIFVHSSVRHYTSDCIILHKYVCHILLGPNIIVRGSSVAICPAFRILHSLDPPVLPTDALTVLIFNRHSLYSSFVANHNP